jgi:RimJ/RimL family protein N-acetyltransferase
MVKSELIWTERLVLRDLTEDDQKAVHSYASDPEVVRYMDWGPNTEQETVNFIQRSIAAQKEQPRTNYTLATVLKADNTLIGSCGIHISSPENKEGWIGYCLNRHYWGQGYATETASALVGFGFAQLSLHRIFATCVPANTASAHVLEKTGLKLEGHLREHRWVKCVWRDSLLYATIDREWAESRSTKKA